MAWVRFLYLLALAVWVGEIVFFSFVVAPAVFGVLDGPRAGAVVSAIFPRYYALGATAGAVAVACAVVLARRATAGGWWTATFLESSPKARRSRRKASSSSRPSPRPRSSASA